MSSKLRIVFLSVTICCLAAAAALAQSQRLGIAPQKFTLQAKGKARAVEAYCLDRHLFASEQPKVYDNVLAGVEEAFVKVGNQPSVSLQTAISKKLIKVEGWGDGRRVFGSGLNIKFTNYTRLPVTIELRQSVVFGERPGQYTNNAVLDGLAKRNPDSKAKQERLWKADTSNRQLVTLGFVRGRPDEITPAKLREATLDFQKSQGLNPTGDLNYATAKALESGERDLMNRLSRVGLYEVRDDTTVQDVSDSLRLFQSFHGLEETGIYNNKVAEHLAERGKSQHKS